MKEQKDDTLTEQLTAYLAQFSEGQKPVVPPSLRLSGFKSQQPFPYKRCA